MTRAFVTGISTNGPFSITGVNSPVSLNGSNGTSNQVLTSTGAGTTPIWATPTVSVDQTLLYPGYIYTSSSNYALDFAGSAGGQSILGSTTRGFPMDAGYTYDFDLYFMVGQTYATSTTMSLSFGYDFSTISGSPTQSHAFFNQVSTSTILGASGTTTQSRTTGGSVTIVAAVTTGSRYAAVVSRGQVRVSGTGQMKIFPKITASITSDNGVTVYSDLAFKVRRVGTNAVTTIGTWTT
jgi:hypothetical protein